MQRKIKFRAWHLGHKRMFTGDELISIDFKKKGALLYFQYGWTTLATLHLMQFTGLNDKNGKEIYEGDILKANYTDLLTVVFENGSFCFANNINSGSDRLHQNRTERLEVVGNIFENPELTP